MDIQLDYPEYDAANRNIIIQMDERQVERDHAEALGHFRKRNPKVYAWLVELVSCMVINDFLQGVDTTPQEYRRYRVVAADPIQGSNAKSVLVRILLEDVDDGRRQFVTVMQHLKKPRTRKCLLAWCRRMTGKVALLRAENCFCIERTEAGGAE